MYNLALKFKIIPESVQRLGSSWKLEALGTSALVSAVVATSNPGYGIAAKKAFDYFDGVVSKWHTSEAETSAPGFLRLAAS